MTMTTDLLNRVSPKIFADFKFKQSDDGQWLNQGKCPACGKRSLFTHADSPWVLRCGRESKCAAQYHIKDLYPNEFGNFNKRFEATPKNPNAVADAYMAEARGFDLKKIKGFYTQENFYHPKGNHGTATVRFYLPQSDSYMERFVESVEITEDDGSKTTRKQNFKGPHRGLWWQPPGMSIDDGDTVWITEAVIDSISLYMVGIKSVAILSCSNFPELRLNDYRTKAVNWVVALDNDKAGKNATRKIVNRMKKADFKVTAAQAPSKDKRDWNDLYRDNKLTDKDIDNYLYHGKLLIAADINEKCALVRLRTNTPFYVTDFNNKLYAFSIKDSDYRDALRAIVSIDEDSGENIDKIASDEEKIEAIKTAGKIEGIANARPEFLYFQSNEITGETRFYCRVHFPDYRTPIELEFPTGQVTSVSDFKKILVSAHGAWFKGGPKHLDYIGEHWLSNLKRIQTINFMGYAKEFDAYIFPTIAVQKGRVFELNQENFFDLPKMSVKTTFVGHGLLPIEPTPTNYHNDWAQLIYTAFGTDGIIAAVFWFASLYAEQIRAKQASFPFLEIIGEPGAGKTTLVNFLWKIWGRKDDEGIDPNKNSSVGNQRKMMQVANMPVVFIEADRSDESHAKKYDWNEVKPYYNGRGLRVTGAKTQGVETNEAPFRATLVIEQNAPVNADAAVMERIVQLNFTKAGRTNEGRDAVTTMSSLSSEELSHFVIMAASKAQHIIDYVVNKAPLYQQELLKHEDIHNDRLALNHAQLVAFTEKFAELAGLSKEQTGETCVALKEACLARQKVIARDHPIVEEFWDMFNFLNTRPADATTCALDHSSDPRTIAVNLNEFVEMAGYAKQHIPPLIEIKRQLSTSKNYKFITASKPVASAIKKTATGGSKTIRCWIFELPKGVTKVERAE